MILPARLLSQGSASSSSAAPQWFPRHLLAALAVLIAAQAGQAAPSTLFLGGSPIDPNGWNVTFNWQNLTIPSAGNDVTISAGAFARYNIGSQTYSHLTLGQSSGTATRLEISRGSFMIVNSGEDINNGFLTVFGTLSHAEPAAFLIAQGGTAYVGEGVSNADPAKMLFVPGSSLFIDGALQVAQKGALNLYSEPGKPSVAHVGSTGYLLVDGGELGGAGGIEVADNGRVQLAGKIDSRTSISLLGSNATLTLNNERGIDLGDINFRIGVSSSSGGQLIVTNKGSVISPVLSGSNVRVKIEYGTELVQYGSTSGASIELQDTARLSYFTPNKIPGSGTYYDPNYSNSIGGVVKASGTATISFNSDHGATRTNMTSVQLTLNNALDLGANSNLRLIREGADLPTGAPLQASFPTFDQWTVGANATFTAGANTRLSGTGLYNLANANLTTRLEGDAILDLSGGSFSAWTINRLASDSATTLVMSGSKHLTLNGGDYAGQVSTSAGLTIGGNVTLRAAQSYSGSTTILSGAALTLSGGTLGSGAATINGTLNVAGASGTSLSLANLTGSGTVNYGSKALTFTNAEAAAKTLGATLNGTGPITKDGGGTTIFTGTVAGASLVQVNAGAFIVNGGISGAVNVGSGATLGGDGTTGPVTLASGATISPGSSPGTLTTGGMTWAGGAGYLWEINNAAGTRGAASGWDWLNVAGSLTLNATSANPFSLTLSSLTLSDLPGAAGGFVPGQTYNFTFATASGGITGFQPDRFLLDASAFDDGLGSRGTFSIAQSGNNLVLRYATIPEPASAMLLAVGLGWLVAKRRRPAAALSRA